MAVSKSSGSARRRKLTPTGSGMYRGLYRPEMQMPEPTISSLLFFDKCPEKSLLADQFEQHIWPLYRFNSLVVDGHFVPVSGPMDRAYHFLEKDVANEDELHNYVQNVMSKSLDHKYPLWQVILLKSGTGQSGAVIRVHHTISDGLGLLFAFLPLMNVEGGDPLSKIPLPGMLTGRKGNASIKKEKKAGFPNPLRVVSGMFGSVRMCFRGIMSLLIMKADSEIKMNPSLAQRTPYLKYAGHHVFTRMPSVPMSAVKAVREKHNCTVNDAIMAALAGAMRKYGIEERKDPLLMSGGPVECKSFMLLGLPRPINPQDASVSLANNILTPVFRIPIDEATAIGRLQRTVAMCNDLKSMAYIAGINLTTKFITKVAPTSVMRSIASEAISKGTSNVTCLPLTSVPFSFGGQEVKEVQCIFVNNIPQISLLTYNGKVCWNMVHDPALVPNAAALGQYFLSEFEALAK